MNKSRAANPRRAYRCTGCGLVIHGKLNARGEVVACDRAPTVEPEKVAAALCMDCADAERDFEKKLRRRLGL